MRLYTGVVVASSEKNDPLLDKRVFLLPMRGWERDPDAPESKSVRVLSALLELTHIWMLTHLVLASRWLAR